MILVLANRADEGAAALVDRWQYVGARIVLPEMLSAWGFSYRAGGKESARAMVDCDVDESCIRGVLVRMHAALPSDVTYVRASDRSYVATEMTAFLLAWLSALSCPVLGRPTSTSLAGPMLRPEQWLHVAGKAGVPVRPVRRSSRQSNQEKPIVTEVVTVVENECIGARSEALADRALAVARAANARLVTTYFEGPLDNPVFVHADTWVDLDDPDIEGAVLSILCGQQAREKEMVP
ncbi:MAG: hypothetical protein IPM54_08725 [Polyangiaceae bacterium]|nr:hypothetical protein [Polyangiaceae bacterium]